MADLKVLRKKIGLTQAELAEKVGVSENTIQNWESGKIVPKGENLNLYMQALGIKNQSDIARIIGEITVNSCIDDSIDSDSIPLFLLPENIELEQRIKDCHASVEELDMLGYERYLRGNSKYANIEKRVGLNYPLEFSFFERYGGFNAAMKKLNDAKRRLGALWLDAIEFAENKPGYDYRLMSFEGKELLEKIGTFVGNKSLEQEIRNRYDLLKTIELFGKTVSLNPNKLQVIMEKQKEIARILKNYSQPMLGNKNFGTLEGYIRIKDDAEENLNISMIELTTRGVQLIEWVEKNPIKLQ